MFDEISEHNVGKLLGHIKKPLTSEEVRPDEHLLRENKQRWWLGSSKENDLIIKDEVLWKTIKPSNYFCCKSHDSIIKVRYKVVNNVVLCYHTISSKRKSWSVILKVNFQTNILQIIFYNWTSQMSICIRITWNSC